MAAAAMAGAAEVMAVLPAIIVAAFTAGIVVGRITPMAQVADADLGT